MSARLTSTRQGEPRTRGLRLVLGAAVVGLVAATTGLVPAATAAPKGHQSLAPGQVARRKPAPKPAPLAPAAVPDEAVPAHSTPTASGATNDATSPPLSAPVPPTPAPQPQPGGSGAESWLPTTPNLWPEVVSATGSSPLTITHGVSWTQDQYETVGGAQKAQVLNVDLADPNIRLGMVEAGDSIVNPNDEVISSMANRTGAVAGVNADFFAIHASGSPEGMVVHNGELQESPVTSWPDDVEVLSNGQVQMSTESFSGTVTDATQSSSQTLGDVNRLGLGADSQLSLETPAMGGALPIGSSVIATATLQAGSTINEPTLVVDSVATGQNGVPSLSGSTMDLVASTGTAAATWLTGTVKVGDTLNVSEATSPYPLQGQTTGSTPYVATAVSGGADLLTNGQLGVPLQGGGENNVNYPIVGIGVTKDGTHAIMAVFDGRLAENQAVGLTRPQFAEWFAQQGAYNAVEFDSGGSAEMVGRAPGGQQVSVFNTPSDGAERPVANGLFVYSTEASAGPAVTTQVNDGQPLTMLAGSTLSVPVSATDAEGNPATGTPQIQVVPGSAATVVGTSRASNGNLLVQLKAGARNVSAQMTVTDGASTATEPLKVVTGLSSLALSPGDPNISNSGTVAFSLTGTAGGASVVVPNDSASWSVNPSSLGSVTSDGVFTGAASGSGLPTVSATAGGVTGSTTVAVGQTSQTVDPMTDVSAWAMNTTEGATGSLSTSTDAPAGFSGSMDIHYNIPGGSGVKQVVFYPNTVDDQINELNGATPQGVGMWVKGGSPPVGAALANGVLTLAEQWLQSGNGSSLTFYPTGVDFDGWTFIEANLPAGLQFPLSLNFLDLLVINPASTLSGDVQIAGLQALYSPRPVVTPPYVPIPKNPNWLQYEGSPADFTPGGQTVMSFDDAHLVATDPGSTSAVDLGVINQQLPTLPPQARPQAIVAQGDMVDSGTIPNLDFLQQELNQFNLPYHLTVGNHEISQGANPENVNYTSVFGSTHYSWNIGNAEFIHVDDAHGGVVASDPYQVPAESQYPWLVQQLSNTTASDVVIVAHEPAYDPHIVMNSQMGDRYEAQMYELLAQEFQATHPKVHVTLLFGHARGFSEQLLNQYGQPVPNGIPNIVVADLGVPAYAPSDQGGLYHYVLFNFLPDGTVQFAVQPILASMAVDSPAHTSLTIGTSETLTATGTSYAGDDYPAITVPIADPVSHVWSSSNPSILTVDPETGQVHAKSTGTATIAVEAGTITASMQLTVIK